MIPVHPGSTLRSQGVGRSQKEQKKITEKPDFPDPDEPDPYPVNRERWGGPKTQFFKYTNFSCSEFLIDLDTLKALVPSRCDLDVEVCRRTCHAIGRREGMCLDDEIRGKVLDINKI